MADTPRRLTGALIFGRGMYAVRHGRCFPAGLSRDSIRYYCGFQRCTQRAVLGIEHVPEQSTRYLRQGRLPSAPLGRGSQTWITESTGAQDKNRSVPALWCPGIAWGRASTGTAAKVWLASHTEWPTRRDRAASSSFRLLAEPGSPNTATARRKWRPGRRLFRHRRSLPRRLSKVSWSRNHLPIQTPVVYDWNIATYGLLYPAKASGVNGRAVRAVRLGGLDVVVGRLHAGAADPQPQLALPSGR